MSLDVYLTEITPIKKKKELVFLLEKMVKQWN